MKSKCKGNKIVIAFLILFSTIVFHSESASQTRKRAVKKTRTENLPVCKIAGTVFSCPEGYTKEENIDENTLLFKEKSSNTSLYVFISIPKDKFNEDTIKNKIARKIALNDSKEFLWKESTPFLMTMKTKFEKTKKVSIGFNDSVVVNFISRQFNFKDKNIIIGYGYRLSSSLTKEQFEKLNGGDNGVGCNEIATILNSITKESKEEKQYCYLMAVGF